MAGSRAQRAWRSPAHSQHVLRTEVAAEIVRDACLKPDDLVVDLGAGTGRLTSPLARAARRVIAVELDPRLARRLHGRWPNVEVIAGDAAKTALPDMPFRVVANIPFSRTNDLLHHLLDDPCTPLERADLVVQWGVAKKRGTPWPSTLWSVVWGAFYEAEIARHLPPSAFHPPPAVDSGVLVFRRRAHPLVPAAELGAYRRFVAHGFRHGIRSRVPARELDPHQWAGIWRSA